MGSHDPAFYFLAGFFPPHTSMMADQICTDPPATGRFTPRPRRASGKYNQSKGERSQHCNPRPPPQQMGTNSGGSLPRHGQGQVPSGPICKGVSRERGRHGGLLETPHNPTKMPRTSRRATGMQIRAKVQSSARGGGEGPYLGVQDRVEFQPHSVITESLSRKKETHCSGAISTENIWAPLPTRRKSTRGPDLQGQKAWG